MNNGDIEWYPSHSTEKIYCPIVILRNSNDNDNTDTNDKNININSITKHQQQQQPNLNSIRKYITSVLLPHQDIVLVSSDHYIDEHPLLSVALASSYMTYITTIHNSNNGNSNSNTNNNSNNDGNDDVNNINNDIFNDNNNNNNNSPIEHIEKVPYIDSNLLFHQLISVGDNLCDLLLHQTGKENFT